MNVKAIREQNNTITSDSSYGHVKKIQIIIKELQNVKNVTEI